MPCFSVLLLPSTQWMHCHPTLGSEPSTLNSIHKASCLAVLGTASDVGKSVLATALCRIYSDAGLRVAPFKAQNMSNNSGVTPEGLEMGRAQIVQAEAARIVPHVDMNPVLLKPVSDVGAQVVLMGEAWTDASAREYDQRKSFLFGQACAALDRLRAGCDVVILEGAGSCAEVNLMERDIVNLSMAEYAEAPALLVADIHRGGVFAQVIGTLACLDDPQRQRIQGIIINRFRGDGALFADGSDWIARRTGLPFLGVLPWFDRFHVAAEDAVPIEHPEGKRLDHPERPSIAVIRLPHLSNFDEFDPLAHIEGLNLVFLERPCDLGRFRAVILPGTKNTRGDLRWLDISGWSDRLKHFAAQGGNLLGICGGYQLMGQGVHDPHGIEGPAGSSAGLGLLPVTTELKNPKTTTRTAFSWDGIYGLGYEIHMGRTRRAGADPLFHVIARNQTACADTEGCSSAGGRILGTYIHGIFDAPDITRRWLACIGLHGLPVDPTHGAAARDQAYDQLAAHVRRHLDIAAIDRLLGVSSEV